MRLDYCIGLTIGIYIFAGNGIDCDVAVVEFKNGFGRIGGDGGVALAGVGVIRSGRRYLRHISAGKFLAIAAPALRATTRLRRRGKAKTNQRKQNENRLHEDLRRAGIYIMIAEF